MSRFIKLNSINQLKMFINEATKVDGDVVCKRGIYCVDGKSLLGLMSIDVADGFTVSYPDDAEDFNSFVLNLGE